MLNPRLLADPKGITLMRSIAIVIAVELLIVALFLWAVWST